MERILKEAQAINPAKYGMTIELKHKECGGVVVPDETILYDHTDDAGKVSKVPAYRCSKCGKEILGDADLEDVQT